MKYFTKEWVELSQTTSIHLNLKKDEHAESFSEVHFHQLYNQKLEELSKEEKISYNPFVDSFTPEQIDENMSKALIYKQERIKKALPKEILKEIADIRVFALGKATLEVINAVKQFCEENEKVVRSAIEQYAKYLKKLSETYDENIVKNIYFHDCIVKDIKQSAQYLSISFDNTGGFTDIEEITFENYRILKQESSLHNLKWLYEEIYKTDGLYELHVLFLVQDTLEMDLVEFIICAEHISFVR